MEKEKEESKFPKRVKVKINLHQDFGQVLAEQMEAGNWSCQKLGDAVGLTRNQISTIRGGGNPSWISARKITAFFNCTVGWKKIPSMPRAKKKKAISESGEEGTAVKVKSRKAKEKSPAAKK